MKKVIYFFALAGLLLVAVVGCKSSQDCPAYSQSQTVEQTN